MCQRIKEIEELVYVNHRELDNIAMIGHIKWLIKTVQEQQNEIINLQRSLRGVKHE